mmetsp:Transcript_31274/g.43520  ORF Transcript_31274/g.43520 Transcript_31274/m.43520 type:complete len:91 (-) Transcript_31274:685-957(-)
MRASIGLAERRTLFLCTASASTLYITGNGFDHAFAKIDEVPLLFVLSKGETNSARAESPAEVKVAAHANQLLIHHVAVYVGAFFEEQVVD